MPYLELPSHRLHYRIDGRVGPWLVFCNSLGTDLTMWGQQVAGLEQQFRILRYDGRGHGASGTPPGPYAIADLGSDVLALLDALHIERAHFCGLSIGGLTGQWLALNAAHRFGHLVLCATASRIGSARGWTERIGHVRAGGLFSIASATQDRWFTSEYSRSAGEIVRDTIDSFVNTSVEGYIGCCSALASADFSGLLGKLTNPVLTIAGADDAVCPPAQLAEIAQNVQHGELCVLPGRHMVNIESAMQFNTTLAKVLAP
ncbi:3-oxoadipate enol-lactonase [Rhizobium subbaraonis]|uniref:3-oxoadipate enol-lactonase n=1 Tax=Rhizobium subbaraonis TaxID=908946 RepID=A0A285V5T7_9HYPH|nr:3-oxoadipate enol-lactonase [Rhizobium subbaraonis]SOC48396.1 3-oxoadipate enol-lactonase [Rhizobium subbaraonis]